MGITASYARVSSSDLDGIRAEPDEFWEVEEMSWDLSETAPKISERLELDKMWDNLSWLCSPLGRAEAHQMAALVRIGTRIKAKDEFKAALAKEVARMGLIWVDPDTLPDDPILSAIQGRRGNDQKSDIPDCGLHASIFTPAEVENLYSALSALNLDDLRKRFVVREIEALQLAGDWEEYELEKFYLPAFQRLKTLYGRAARAGQHVIVVMA